MGSVLLAAITAGCSTGSTVAPSQAVLQHEAQLNVAKNVYVFQQHDRGTGTLLGFGPQNLNDSSPICTRAVPARADGIGVDAAGNVYVPETNIDQVQVFAPGCGSLVASLRDPHGPIGATVMGSTIFIADRTGVEICTLHGCSAHLTDSSISKMRSAAVDSAGNVWAAYYNQVLDPSLIVWRHAAMPGKVAGGYHPAFNPGEILFDRNDFLITIQYGIGEAIRYRCSAGSAVCVGLNAFALHNRSNFGALNAANDDIQISNVGSISVDVYAYPGFTYQYSYDSGFSRDGAVKGIAQVP